MSDFNEVEFHKKTGISRKIHEDIIKSMIFMIFQEFHDAIIKFREIHPSKP